MFLILRVHHLAQPAFCLYHKPQDQFLRNIHHTNGQFRLNENTGVEQYEYVELTKDNLDELADIKEKEVDFLKRPCPCH